MNLAKSSPCASDKVGIQDRQGDHDLLLDDLSRSVQTVVGAGVFVVEEVVGVVALDFADLLRAEAELLGVAVGRGGFILESPMC